MCGFIGAFGIFANRVDVHAGMSSISHRGPNASRVLEDRSHRVGACVLNTVPGEFWQQPAYEAGNGLLCFNGVIYNAASLAKEYLSRADFAENISDTRIVFELFKRFGPSIAGKFDGMFAISWQNNDELFLLRDRFGIKPLLYCTKYSEGTLVYGSELKGIRSALAPIEFQLNLKALGEFLVIGFPLNGSTLFENVESVPPGSCLKFGLDPKGRVIQSLPPQTLQFTSPTGVDTLVEDFLERSVIECLRLKGSIGLLLSGGIDSSLIAAAIPPELRPNVPAIFLSYPGDFEEYLCHLKIAESLGMRSQRVSFGNDITVSMFESIYAVERPLAFSSSYIAGKFAKQIELKSLLVGDGADERFAGYETARRCGRLVNIYSSRLNSLNRLPTDVFNEVKDRICDFAVNPRKLDDHIIGDQLAYGQCDLTDKGLMYSGIEGRLPYLCNWLDSRRALGQFASTNFETKDILRRTIERKFTHPISSKILGLKKRAASTVQLNFRKLIKDQVDALEFEGYFHEHPMNWAASKTQLLKIDIFIQNFALHGPNVETAEDLIDSRSSIFSFYESGLNL